MTFDAPPEHGGNLDAARQRFGEPADGWLDLSTGINPVAYGDTALSDGALQRLPAAAALAALLDAARACYGVPGAAGLAAGPGTQAILQVLPALMPDRAVVVLGPTYEEHAFTWRALGHDVREAASLAEAADADVVVVVNPNNPDGRVAPALSLLEMADALAARGGWLVVDEAFADLDPDISVAGLAGPPGLLVVRSFGKFYGLGGLRLGFLAGPRELTDAVAARLGPWAVSGPALEIGHRALADADWAHETRRRLEAMAARLDGVLGDAGLTVVGGTSLFRLVETGEAGAVYERLGRAGILVRRFERHPRWLRFGIPDGPFALERLAAALSGG